MGNKGGGRVVTPWPIRCWGLHFNGTSLYIHTVQHTYTQFWPPQNSTCGGSSATWSHRKSAVHFIGCSLSHYVLWSEYDLEVVNSIFSYHFAIMPKERTENHKLLWYLVNQPKFELGTSWMQATLVNLFSTIRSRKTVLHIQEIGQWL